MKKLTKDTIVVYGALSFFILVIYPILSDKQDAVYEAHNGVNIFPISSESKNYRLDATLRHTGRLYPFFIKEDKYQLIDVTWPNGGTVEADCDPYVPVPSNQRITCTIGEDRYYVEFNVKA